MTDATTTPTPRYAQPRKLLNWQKNPRLRALKMLAWVVYEPIHHVQQMLGHADLKTTSRYINATTQGLHESMKKFGTGQPLHELAHEVSTDPQSVGNENPATSAKSAVN